MKAYVYRRYGGPEVIEFAEVPKPSPREDEVLIRVYATTVTAGDWRARSLTMPRGFGSIARLVFGLRRPRQPILGTELAGVVEAVGQTVTRFRPGDAVFAFPGGKLGAHAEYVAMKADAPIARKPDALSFEEAASLPFGATTALHFLGKAGVRPGETMLVVGASGNVGTALVQLARHAGAHVTAVTSAPNLELVASLGAERSIDYTKTDPLGGGATYDVIADTVGEITVAKALAHLRENGRFLAIAGDLPTVLASARGARKGGKRVIAGPAPERREDLERIAELAQSGVLRPVIDRRYGFAEMVEAHRYVDTRRKRGSVVVTVRSEQT